MSKISFFIQFKQLVKIITIFGLTIIFTIIYSIPVVQFLSNIYPYLSFHCKIKWDWAINLDKLVVVTDFRNLILTDLNK